MVFGEWHPKMLSEIAKAAYVLDPFYWPTDSNHVGSDALWAECIQCLKEFARRLFSQQAGLRYVLTASDINEEVDAEVDKAMDELIYFQSKTGTYSSASVKMSAKRSASHLWWAKHGNPTPRLKRLGKRLTSKVASQSAAETDWKEVKEAYTKKRNALDTSEKLQKMRLYKSVMPCTPLV